MSYYSPQNMNSQPYLIQQWQEENSKLKETNYFLTSKFNLIKKENSLFCQEINILKEQNNFLNENLDSITPLLI